MKITPNIGILNALIRITCGLTMLTWCTAKLVRKPRKESYLLVAILSAMKVAEGIVRYCPLTDFIKSSQNKENHSKHPEQKYDNHDIPSTNDHKNELAAVPKTDNTNGINLMDELKKFQEDNDL